MTPTVLADRLESANVRRLQKGINNVPLWDVAAAMLREAERLLKEPVIGSGRWHDDRDAWLEGRTP